MKHFISLKIIFLLFFLSSKSQDLYTLSPLEYLLSSTNSKSELLGMICNDNNLWLLFNYDYNLYLMTYDLKNKTNDLQIITNDYKQSPKVKYQLFTNLSDIQIMKIESKKSLVDISFFQKHGSN